MKCQITLEIETRPFTAEELAAEGEDTPAEDDDDGFVEFLDEPSPKWLADQIVTALTEEHLDEFLFGGSSLFQKIASAKVISADRATAEREGR